MIPILIRDYFGPWHPSVTQHLYNCKVLLAAVTPLLQEAQKAGVEFKVNPNTSTLVSGEKYGGYRPAACTIGAPTSAHKTGEAVDVYDVGDALDRWLDKFEGSDGQNSMLEKHGLYREHPEDTDMKPGQVAGWCHLSTRAPKSGRRTFKP